jgi:glycosyltransferase involved in cell wall biosynthesis
MRFLILTQYYPPETGAPQNRLSGLARELKQMGHEVVILTAMPNYPAMQIHPDYHGKKYVFDVFENIAVHRAWIYVSKNRSIISRLMNYFSFTFSSMFYASKIKGKFDYLMVESPPLFLGISAWWISKRKKAKMVFNVSDLWPESAEKLGVISNKMFLKLATILEEWLYKKSYMVTGQTQGIVQNIKTRFPNKKVHWLPNGIDPDDYVIADNKSWRNEEGYDNQDFILLYAGIIGHAQGLEVILHAAQTFRELKNIKFILLGDGPEKENLIKLAASLKIVNVRFIDVVPKNKVKQILASSDATIIPLRNIPLFKGAIPSKIFESLYLKKPILLGVDGEARQLFITQGNCGFYFKPDDPQALALAIRHLISDKNNITNLGENGNLYVTANFTRRMITSNFINSIIENEKKRN